jgi:hypothetical protein
MQPKAYSYIRFSSPEQEKGDSVRRQVQQSEEYAKQHGLELDDTLKMTDRGMSAYKGHHKAKGALGEFLKLVEEGEIAEGSLLIVENLDRLSREQVLDALNQFTSIIRAGIKLITLQDGQEYSRESIDNNWTQLIMSITYMARAHEESQAKAKRLAGAWKNKREKAANGNHVLTSRCPDWLQLNDSKTGFEKIPEACKVVELIYRWKLNGMGNETITRELNKGGYWKPPRGSWRKSYVMKILRNQAVIGEFQPHEFYTDDEGKQKRKPVGDPIPNYYPAIISEDLYWAVQEKLRQNRNKGGRTGKVSNLFTHLLTCGYCGGSITYINKGQTPKGGEKLVCDRARRGAGCHRYYLNYKEAEKLLLEYCRGLDAKDIMPDRDKVKSELAQWETRLQAIDGQLEDLEAKEGHVTDSIADTANKNVRRRLEEKLSSLLEEKAKLQSEREEVDKTIKKLKKNGKQAERNLNAIRELQEEMEVLEGNELIKLRQRLRERLRELIDQIIVYPVGQNRMTKQKVKEGLEAVKEVQPELKRTKELERFRQALYSRIDNKDLRTFHVLFAGGHRRILRPVQSPTMPLDLDRDAGQLVNRFLNEDGEVEEVVI